MIKLGSSGECHQMLAAVSHNIMPEAMSFRPVPRRNPANAPRADLADVHTELPANASSAMNAPANAPAMMPTGGTNIPMNIPAVAPQPAYLLPPLAFVIHPGTK